MKEEEKKLAILSSGGIDGEDEDGRIDKSEGNLVIFERRRERPRRKIWLIKALQGQEKDIERGTKEMKKEEER